MTNDVNDHSSPYRRWTRPKDWKPLPSPKDIPKQAGRRIKKKLKVT